MTIDARGHERGLGWWRPEWDADARNRFLPRVGLQLDALHKIGIRLHNQNRAILQAEAERKTPLLPEPQVRIAQARREQKQLRDVEQQIRQIEGESALWRIETFKPFDHSWEAGKREPRRAFQGRAELRAVFARLDPEQRAAALKREEFKAAILEMPPQASGMSEAEYNLLERLILEERFAPELKVAADTREAIDSVREAKRTVEIALENELKSIGEPVVEKPPPAPSNTWA
jgi:hypothetical protein